MELSPVFNEIKKLRNGIKGMGTSWQDLTQLGFQVLKRNTSLRRPVVAGTYNPSTTEAKRGRVLPGKFPNYEK